MERDTGSGAQKIAQKRGTGTPAAFECGIGCGEIGDRCVPPGDPEGGTGPRERGEIDPEGARFGTRQKGDERAHTRGVQPRAPRAERRARCRQEEKETLRRGPRGDRRGKREGIEHGRALAPSGFFRASAPPRSACDGVASGEELAYGSTPGNPRAAGRTETAAVFGAPCDEEGRDSVAIHLGVISPQRPFVIEELERRGFVIHRAEQGRNWQEWARILAPWKEEIRGLLSGGMTGLPRGLIEALPRLEICAIFGVGLETTDLDAAKERGIVVTTAPVLFDDVADHALALALAACRRIVEADRFVRSGRWRRGRMGPGRSFWGKRYGIVGLGRIGSALARRLEGFGGTIGYVDPAPKPEVPYRRFEDALSLARESDVLFLCAAGTPGSGPILTRSELEALGPEGVFVNVARGWLVEEDALVELLAERKLGAAGLDVFADEPNVPERLLGLDNVVLAPHIASSTEECLRRMGECVIANIVEYFATGRAVTPVRPQPHGPSHRTEGEDPCPGW